MQTGTERVYIYEVGYDPKSRKTYGEPIKLNMTNYMVPYDTLVNGGNPPDYDSGETVVESTETSSAVVAEVAEATMEEETIPEVKEETVEEVAVTESSDDTDVVEVESVEEKVEEVQEEEATTDVVDEVKDTAPATKKENPYKGMTKAERRALRKKQQEEEIARHKLNDAENTSN